MTRVRILLTTFLILISPLASASLSTAHKGMVVTEHALATKVGVDILKSGGNAFDAAVAVGYALAVVNPCCGNIGGGGFMVAHLANGKNIFVNFREKAPQAATRDMFVTTQLAEPSNYGYLAVGVPGTVRGFEYILKKYGSLTRSAVIAPSISLAKEGFTVTPYLHEQISQVKTYFAQEPNVAAIFLKNKEPISVGQLLIQTNLANTLTEISARGEESFYKGNIAKTIVKTSEFNHGILTLKDFADYNVTETAPLQCSYHGYTIISAPPPSSGGVTLCEMLNILENFPLHRLGLYSAQSKRYIIEAMRYAFNDRNSKLGDPAFVTNPIDHLISKEYAKTISEEILLSNFSDPPTAKIPRPELTDTTHYSIIDQWGNAVSVTYTINGLFGSKVMAGDTGFFLNNEMDDFATIPGVANKFGLVQSETNDIQPSKRPLSSMTPTIVMKDNKVVMVIGSPGGPRIITSTLLALVNFFDFDMDLDAAIQTPRFHYQGLPDEIDMEPFAFDFFSRSMLRFWDYHLNSERTWGAVEAVYIDPDTGTIYGANDNRRPDGAARGY